MNCNPVRSAVSLLISIFVTVALAIAQNPCGNGERRALVLSGGGIKGGFEAGAVYHLVVHRGCDFHDFAGISVGALNATFLAQAAPHYDPERSHDSLAREASALVELWESMKSQKEIVRGRPLASIRLYSPVFAADSLNDFRPLRRLLDTRISTERLDGGRPVRVGVTSFGDGTYHEIAINYPDSEIGPERFLDYVYASASLPVIGKQVRICDGNSARERSCSWYADGSLRHITPVTSYFPTRGNTSEQLPAHDSVQQLFVIVTSPYPNNPDPSPACQGRKGSQIMRCTITHMVNTPFRADLDFMFASNDLLQWRWSNVARASGDADGSGGDYNGNSHSDDFPVGSYNLDAWRAGALARPYTIGFVAPVRETADVRELLTLSPIKVREQLYSGCLAADRTMQRDFSLPSMASECDLRFSSMPAAQVASATKTRSRSN